MKKSGLVGIFIAVLIPIIFLLVFMPKRDARQIYMPLRHWPVGLDTTTDEDGALRIDTAYYQLPDWRYISHLGDSIGATDLDGKIYVVDFFFSHCPGICPKMKHQMKRLQTTFLNDDNFALVSFTIDPKRDTVQRLRAFARETGVIPGKWYMCTGNMDSIHHMASQQFKIAARAVQEGETGEDGFVHSDRFMLIDDQRHIRGYYNGTDSLSVNKLIQDIVLLVEKDKKGRKRDDRDKD